MDGKPFNRPWEWVETKTAQDKAEEAGGTDALLELKQLGQEATTIPFKVLQLQWNLPSHHSNVMV